MSTNFRVAVLGPKGQCGRSVVDELPLPRTQRRWNLSLTPKHLVKAWGLQRYCMRFGNIQGLSTILSEGRFDAVISAFAPPLVDLKAVYRLGVEGHGNIKMAIMRSTYRGPVIIIGRLSPLPLFSVSF